MMARTGKTARGLATRVRIVEAATELFVRDGYLTTTVADIAAAAGVSAQAVYLAFGNKAAILKAAHDVAVVGDHEETPVLGRPWVEVAADCRDARSALDVMIDNVTELTDRAGAIYDVCEATAADPQVGELLATLVEQRRASWQGLVEILATKKGFRADLDPDEAVDILFTLVGPDLRRNLMVNCGWSFERWQDFVRASARAHVLQPGRR